MVTEQLMAFVKQFALTEKEAAPMVERARNPQYWISLRPTMTISRSHPISPGKDVQREIHNAIDDYTQYGHCIVNEAFSANDTEILKSAVLAVHEAGWPMIFAFVYDQFWTVTRLPKMDAFLRALLGTSYQTTVSFWINYVPAIRGGSGFTPHLDDVRPGHHSVTCWLPLTAATPDNGCVYVMENNVDSRAVTNTFVDAENFTAAEVCSALVHVRALPANPGSFLAWPNTTLHWGGMFLRGNQARLALSWHFTSADYENIDSALRSALLPDHPLPRFEDRLRWVCHSMLRFRARDPVLERFAPIAHELIAHCAS
jgi:hypothetical protein